MLNFENLSRMQCPGVGRYDIPELAPQEYSGCEWIGFNAAKGKRDGSGKGVHFFLDDYHFTSLWTSPDRYVALLQRFDYVMTPDFSLYTDMPRAMQIYNHYRKHWIGAYLQPFGIRVIPTISWSNKASYEWCFDGEPSNSTVAISTAGTQRSKHTRAFFLSGFEAMMEQLTPTVILCYGKMPDEIKPFVVGVGCFCDEMLERVKGAR